MLRYEKVYNDNGSGELSVVPSDITLISGAAGIGVSSLLRNYLHNKGVMLPIKLIDNTTQYYLNKYDNSIMSFAYEKDTNNCFLYFATSVAGECDTVLLNQLGNGVIKYMEILTTILASGRGGTVILDNIDVYLHYTKFKLIWEMVFDLSERFNIKVLASTQSMECIEAFNRHQLAYTGTQSSSYIEIRTNIKTGVIVSKSRDKEQLQYALSHGREIRGE